MASNNLEIQSQISCARKPNTPSFTDTGVQTLLEVGPFELAHILKADKISVHMTYYTTMQPHYRLSITKKTKCDFSPCAYCSGFQNLECIFRPKNEPNFGPKTL